MDDNEFPNECTVGGLGAGSFGVCIGTGLSTVAYLLKIMKRKFK